MPRDAAWNRGNYLVDAVARCESCHTPPGRLGGLKRNLAFSGFSGSSEEENVPNITSDRETGIGSWSLADIGRLLKAGTIPDLRTLDRRTDAAWRGTASLTDEDRRATAIYLKSLPPIRTEGRVGRP